MRFTTFTDYSLRTLIYLAARPERRATIGEVASAFGISQNHLMKVAHLLGREGLLTNTRGKGGGLALARPPRSINIGRVVRATEGPPRPAECFDKERNACAITPVCELRRVLREAVKAFYAVLDRHTLEDLVANRAALDALLSRRVARAADIAR